MIRGDASHDYRHGRVTGDYCTASISGSLIALELPVDLVLSTSWAGTHELAHERGDLIDRIHLAGQVLRLEEVLEGGILLRRAVEGQQGVVQIHLHRACVFQGVKATGPLAARGRRNLLRDVTPTPLVQVLDKLLGMSFLLVAVPVRPLGEAGQRDVCTVEV